MSNIHAKVKGGTVSGAVAVLVLWLLSTKVAVPTPASDAITVIIAALGGWLTPAREISPPAAKK